MVVIYKLIIEGNVQAVGFRALIKQIGRNMRIKGSIKNLDDGTVEIYCECEQNIYEEFKNKINFKSSDTEDPLQINVTNIKEHDESSEGFDSSRLNYPFEVFYDGEEIRPLEKELLERSEMAVFAMTSMNSNLSKKIENTNINIKDMDQHMNDRFNTLDQKYDEFGHSMKRLEQDIYEMKDAFIKLTDHFIKNNKK